MVFALKGNWLILLTIIALFFAGMYTYAAASTFMEKIRAKKARKIKLVKEEQLRLEKIKMDEDRAEKRKLLDQRSAEIKKEIALLSKYKKKIKSL